MFIDQFDVIDERLYPLNQVYPFVFVEIRYILTLHYEFKINCSFGISSLDIKFSH